MKRVITYGVFDYLHLGHVRLLKNIKNSFNERIYLIVGLHKDEYIKQTKPNANTFYNQDERFEMLSAIKYVDEVILYDFVDNDLPKRNFDVLAVGPDQNNEHCLKAIEYCKNMNKSVIVIPRTENISSTKIKEKIIGGLSK